MSKISIGDLSDHKAQLRIANLWGARYYISRVGKEQAVSVKDDKIER